MKRSEFTEFVVFGNLRPKIDSTCGPSDIQSMIKSSWGDDPDERPTFKKIRLDLECVVATKKIPFVEERRFY